jgi:DNA polymerase III psi subunit
MNSGGCYAYLGHSGILIAVTANQISSLPNEENQNIWKYGNAEPLARSQEGELLANRPLPEFGVVLITGGET